MQSVIAEQAEDAVVSTVVASGLTGAGHDATAAAAAGGPRSDDQHVQDRRPGVRGGGFAGSPSAFRWRLAVVARLRATAVTVTAGSDAAAAATTVVVTANATATRRDGGATTGRRVQRQTGATGRRPTGHTRVVTMGRSPPPRPADTAVVRRAGKERFDEDQRQERVSRVQ